MPTAVDPTSEAALGIALLACDTDEEREGVMDVVAMLRPAPACPSERLDAPTPPEGE